VIIYLARPIDQQHDLPPLGVSAVSRLLEQAGFTVYDPGRAWSGEPDGAFIQRVNDAALQTADGVFAIMHDRQASVGVPMEVERAASMGKTVVVWGGVVVARSPVLAARGVPVFTDLQAAVDNLKVRTEGISAGDLKVKPAGDLVIAVSDYLDRVGDEIERARIKHPRSDELDWTTLDRWFSIWAEEVWEAMAAWNDRKGAEQVRSELVQVGAMSMRLWWALASVPPSRSSIDSEPSSEA
jgi:hypothetical protein